MKTLLEVCKGIYEIRRKEWVHKYTFNDAQILELYAGTVEAAAKVMGYTFAKTPEKQIDVGYSSEISEAQKMLHGAPCEREGVITAVGGDVGDVEDLW